MVGETLTVVDSEATLKDIKSSFAADVMGILDELSHRYFVDEILDMRTLDKDVSFINRLLDKVRVTYASSSSSAAD